MRNKLKYKIQELDENEFETDFIILKSRKELIHEIKKRLESKNKSFDVYLIRHTECFTMPPGKQVWFYDCKTDGVDKYDISKLNDYYLNHCKQLQRKLYNLMVKYAFSGVN